MKRPYTWAVHLNISDDLTPKEAAAQWTKTCRSLRLKGIVAIWVREPNKSNKVHYHLMVKNQIGKKQLERAIEESMPSRKLLRWRKRVEPIKNEFRLAHYLTKAKISGYIKGRQVADFHRTKRLLFKTNRAWKKYGVIGAFWERPKKKLWQEIRDIEKKIAEGLEQPNVKQYAKFLFDLVGGYVPLRQIERSIGINVTILLLNSRFRTSLEAVEQKIVSTVSLAVPMS